MSFHLPISSLLLLQSSPQLPILLLLFLSFPSIYLSVVTYFSSSTTVFSTISLFFYSSIFLLYFLTSWLVLSSVLSLFPNVFSFFKRFLIPLATFHTSHLSSNFSSIPILLFLFPSFSFSQFALLHSLRTFSVVVFSKFPYLFIFLLLLFYFYLSTIIFSTTSNPSIHILSLFLYIWSDLTSSSHLTIFILFLSCYCNFHHLPTSILQ